MSCTDAKAVCTKVYLTNKHNERKSSIERTQVNFLIITSDKRGFQMLSHKTRKKVITQCCSHLKGAWGEVLGYGPILSAFSA